MASFSSIPPFSTWQMHLKSNFWLVFTWTTLVASLVCLAVWRSKRRSLTARKKHPFPFLRLPPEIRDSIYELLVDTEPCYPRPADDSKYWPSISSLLADDGIGRKFNTNRNVRFRRLRETASRLARGFAPRTWTRVTRALQDGRSSLHRYLYRSKMPLLFVNRQVQQEFISVLCKRSTVRLQIKDVNQSDKPIWCMSDAMARQIRSCEMMLLATPGMTGSFDPRVAPADWALGDRAVGEMKKMQNLEQLNLQIHACGNQIWNPAWLWHYTCQSFKRGKIQGFSEISFHLRADGWFAGENHLHRNEEGLWEWHCPQGHFVRHDTIGTMSIREFCHALYYECRECSPHEMRFEA